MPLQRRRGAPRSHNSIAPPPAISLAALRPGPLLQQRRPPSPPVGTGRHQRPPPSPRAMGAAGTPCHRHAVQFSILY